MAFGKGKILIKSLLPLVGVLAFLGISLGPLNSSKKVDFKWLETLEQKEVVVYIGYMSCATKCARARGEMESSPLHPKDSVFFLLSPEDTYPVSGVWERFGKIVYYTPTKSEADAFLGLVQQDLSLADLKALHHKDRYYGFMKRNGTWFLKGEFRTLQLAISS